MIGFVVVKIDFVTAGVAVSLATSHRLIYDEKITIQIVKSGIKCGILLVSECLTPTLDILASEQANDNLKIK